MDQQNPNPDRHVPTEAEIARLEAEAARALQRGEAIPRREQAPGGAAQVPSEPVRSNFVPYVDDVPKPQPAKSAEAEAPSEEDEDDEEYIPGVWEKRIDALTPEQWKRWQIICGAVVGLAAVACLFVFGQELATYGLILAFVLAVFLPRYLERAWRHSLSAARVAMIVSMLIGLIVVGIVLGLRNGFSLTAK